MLPQPLSCPWIRFPVTVPKVATVLHEDGHNATLTKSLQENVNGNSFSGHVKLTVWNFITQCRMTNLSSISKILEVISSMCSFQRWPYLCCLYSTTMKENGRGVCEQSEKKCPFYVRKVHPWPSVAVISLRERDVSSLIGDKWGCDSESLNSLDWHSHS